MSYNSSHIPAVLAEAMKNKCLTPWPIDSEGGEDEHFAFMYDLDALREGFSQLVNAFPPHFAHAYAIKAAPMYFVVDAAIQAGLGVEAASLLELENAIQRGCPAERLVFDSPSKTYKELEYALEKGIHVNANCLEELDRINEIITKKLGGIDGYRGSVGLRINPLVGAGTIAELSVSTITSKFGTTLTERNKEIILKKFEAYQWLNALHIHVGSQGFTMNQTAMGVKVLLDFANEVDRYLGEKRVKTLDIGGGLSANYSSDEFNPSYMELARVIREVAPEILSDSSRKVITEFGRSLTAKAGWTVSRVEYAFENTTDLRTAIIHVGADCLLRECYCPNKFPHRISAYSKEGAALPEDALKAHNIAGPLCFAGDLISRSYPLPEVKSGDLLVIHDTGANALALFSRHCSRPYPSVYGYSYKIQAGEEPTVSISLLQRREAASDVLRFWGPPPQASSGV